MVLIQTITRANDRTTTTANFHSHRLRQTNNNNKNSSKIIGNENWNMWGNIQRFKIGINLSGDRSDRKTSKKM
jgi:hypothetical protein